ncbi:MAG: hypothetical protein EP349_04170 [Alphaproteobacteria bacterium]|nr:MAG: hypothetical protein EP349_04170 [Alphaproteobacteria bacterium]
MKRSANHSLPGSLVIFALVFSMLLAGTAFVHTATAQNSPPPPAAYQGVPQGYNYANNKIIRLTPNESHILHLNRNAASVIVANPIHAGVFLDTPRVLVIVPGTPGATSFTVLDIEGNEIMRRDVIISERQNKYVRIQRICAGGSNCVPSSVYFCPDGCHQVSTTSRDSGSVNVSARPSPPPPPSGGATGATNVSPGGMNDGGGTMEEPADTNEGGDY